MKTLALHQNVNVTIDRGIFLVFFVFVGWLPFWAPRDPYFDVSALHLETTLQQTRSTVKEAGKHLCQLHLA